MDSTVRDDKEESTSPVGRKPELGRERESESERERERERDLLSIGLIFLWDFTMDFTGTKADTHLQWEPWKISQIGVKSLSLAIDVRLRSDSGFSL